MTNPFNFRLTSPYGAKRTYQAQGKMFNDVHDGVDFAYPQGTPVTLPPGGEFDGTVIVAQLDQFGGGWVDVKSDKDGGVARFLHFMRIDVKVGQKVKGNAKLGLSGGAEGTYGAGLSTGAHLHIGLFVNNTAVDPLPWLQQAYKNTTIINTNEINMTQKKQLDNFYKAKEDALKDPRFTELFQDERNALGSYDGDDNDASDLGFLLSRILAQRDTIAMLDTTLKDLEARYKEVNTVLDYSNTLEERSIAEVAKLQQELATIKEATPEKDDNQMTSSDKPFYQSKKFIALATGAIAIIAAQLSPELQAVTNELTILLVTYLAGQSSIDVFHTMNE